ncbi:carbohydrate ABC transporter permease [Paenibacillus fonticola]|uniref:carbohydrate ABC transporter permease n=1 Tax=Paenibacillus fonticola TaxID=379896 RepID=UPI00037B18F9|nr:sugar ABC transporter permease [Paenibacillus fonticola]
MEKVLRSRTAILFFILPALLVYTAIVFIPIVSSIYFSFFKWDVVSPMKFIGIDNYIRMFTQDSVFGTSVRNMLLLLAVSLVLQLGMGFVLAVVLSGRLRGKEWFKNVFFMPAVISSVAVGMMWTFIYDPSMGILNELLRAVGLESWTRQWLSDPKTAMWAISIVTSWQFVGYTMILFIAAIQNISADIFEAARIDGATGWKIIKHITIPLVKPITQVNTILISIGSLKFFDLIFVMTGGGPANRTQVIASYLYYRSFNSFEYGYGDAMAVILLMMCLIVTLIINKLFSITNRDF